MPRPRVSERRPVRPNLERGGYCRCDGYGLVDLTSAVGEGCRVCHVQEREPQLEDEKQPNVIFASIVTGLYKQVSVADHEHNEQN